jgi:mannose-6-phosphate isomerase-like protein (cupin superfamily)
MRPLIRRGLLAAFVLLAVLGLTGFLAQAAKPAPAPAAPAVLGSAAFDWEKLPVKVTKVGASRKVCQAPTATLDELEIHITTLNRGEWAHAAHQHPDEELLIVKEGTVEALVNGEWVRLGPGSVIFQASHIEHAIRNAGETAATYHVIKWNSPGMLAKNKAEIAAAKAKAAAEGKK